MTFEATWESLKNYRTPDWYQNGKFGIFVHWGIYAVPAFGNEWYPRNMYIEGSREFEHHRQTYGAHTQFGYKDFIPQFKAEKFDADQWVGLFKEAGAKYFVPVAEHHDGFAMYDYSGSDWTAVKRGPKRDVIGELTAAARKQGVVMGASSHRAEHWWFFDGGRKFDSDVQDPAYDGLYGPAQIASPEIFGEEWHKRDWQPRPHAKFLDDWYARTTELIDKYQPQMIYFDWWIEQLVFEPYLQRLAAYYYNQVTDAAITYKQHGFPEGTATFDVERGQLKGIRPDFWQADTAIAKHSWGYTHNNEYKEAGSLIGDLVDVVSKNGALLLNVGPQPDGTITPEETAILKEMGRWLAINGEAIYDTRPWQSFGEGPTEAVEGAFTELKRQPYTGQDFRFTTKGDTLYAIALAWPGQEALITSLGADGRKVAAVTLLGAGNVTWSQGDAGLHIALPNQKPCDHAFTFKIQFQ